MSRFERLDEPGPFIADRASFFGVRVRLVREIGRETVWQGVPPVIITGNRNSLILDQLIPRKKVKIDAIRGNSRAISVV